jgi:hypothetical protein
MGWTLAVHPEHFDSATPATANRSEVSGPFEGFLGAGKIVDRGSHGLSQGQQQVGVGVMAPKGIQKAAGVQPACASARDDDRHVHSIMAGGLNTASDDQDRLQVYPLDHWVSSGFLKYGIGPHIRDSMLGVRVLWNARGWTYRTGFLDGARVVGVRAPLRAADTVGSGGPVCVPWDR